MTKSGANELSTLRIVEIGPVPLLKSIFPAQTDYFSTFIAKRPEDSGQGSRLVSLGTLTHLLQALREPDVDLIACQPTFFSPWNWRSLNRVISHRRVFRGHLSPIRWFGPQFLRMTLNAPVAVLDYEDIPIINRNNFFLLDRCRTYFKRELPVDRWRVFLKTGHANLPTPRFRRLKRYQRRLAKLEPLSLGLPRMQSGLLPAQPIEKSADVFFSGRIADSSSIRSRGFAELQALRHNGVAVDIADGPLPPDEYYRRCARAWLVWSPEGFGWDCFRHYEAPACWSVPVINHPTIERYRPLISNEHALYYDPEPGGLTRAVVSALEDKLRLARMAEAARDHVLAHHTRSAIAHYIVGKTLGLEDSTPTWATKLERKKGVPQEP
jgi:Glycosyl transferases group 1